MMDRRVNDGGIDLPPPPRRQEPAIFRAGNGCLRYVMGFLSALVVLATLYVITEPARWLFRGVHGWRRALLYVVSLALFAAAALFYNHLRRRRRRPG